MTVIGFVAACESLTSKESCEVPELPSLTEASAIEIVGNGGDGGAVPALSRTSPDTAVPPAPDVAWKPKLAWLPAAMSAFHAALRIT